MVARSGGDAVTGAPACLKARAVTAPKRTVRDPRRPRVSDFVTSKCK
ncbi:MAG: hypothetical protein IT529_08420 [Burkholderiales bacterium]|nr:hypothetical protein [Burkholderiales bacterium]